MLETQPSNATDQKSLNAFLLRKLMPLLILVYVISFLDRANIALAKHAMGIDLGISAAAYGFGAGIFFLTYAAFEIPSNLIMHRVGARLWITRIMITWGILSIGMGFVNGETSFYVMRLLLGAAEAGLFPGVMLYLTYWFGRNERARATGYFLLAVCFASIIGNPLGGALLEMDGFMGFHGWQWLFVIEGLPAVVVAFVVYRLLPDRPSNARWLSTADASAIESRLAAEQESIARPDGEHSFRTCLTDPQVWLAILVYFCHQITVYTVIYFLPSIIGASGNYSPFTIGLLTTIPWIAAAIGSVVVLRFANSSSRSRLLLGIGLLCMAAGMLIAAYSAPVIGLLGICLAASMFYVVQSIIFTFPSSRLSGGALAGGLALVNTCGQRGGFVGPTVIGMVEYTTGKAINGLGFLAIALVVGAVFSRRLRHGNEDVDPSHGEATRAI
ncbi:MFS transporter [Paraburkholderia tropica]|uniref:MFS transporter n=1 Tax=Paraburkholderia tropica TaxID=92647 RepID=UPI002AB65DE0|nr:MFS transporter [Paraburkholderia tropica]